MRGAEVQQKFDSLMGIPVLLSQQQCDALVKQLSFEEQGFSGGLIH